ncbi:MAG: ribonuclease J, partial [Dehalococcoidia bacterium]
SIPDSMGLAIRTPLGTVVHTGDFKLDYTPVMGQATDLTRLAQLGSESVLLLLADSTYAEVPGYTPSERVVGEALDRIIATAPGRVIIATFASLISRIQQVIDAAYLHGRRVFVAGRSMMDNVQMAMQQGYLLAPDGVLAPLEQLRDTPHQETVIVSTGSQGEPTSALVRMANGDHRQVRILPGDTVILSSTPIPGNELLISRTIDNLFRLGADVLHSRIASVHVRGHAAQEELKLVLSLVRPRFFVPVHGEYRHLVAHSRLAQMMGVPKDSVFALEDGDVLELDGGAASVVERVPASHVYVDGLAVGLDHVVLRDRHHLATEGMVVVIMAVDKQTGRLVGRPDVVARGFVDMDRGEGVLEGTREVATKALAGADHVSEWSDVNVKVKDAIAQFLYEKTRRRPMVLPVTLEV